MDSTKWAELNNCIQGLLPNLIKYSEKVSGDSELKHFGIKYSMALYISIKSGLLFGDRSNSILNTK